LPRSCKRFDEEIREAKATTMKKNLSWVRVLIIVSVDVITLDNTVRLRLLGLGMIFLL
jgi:hypothetical protein